MERNCNWIGIGTPHRTNRYRNKYNTIIISPEEPQLLTDSSSLDFGEMCLVWSLTLLLMLSVITIIAQGLPEKSNLLFKYKWKYYPFFLFVSFPTLSTQGRDGGKVSPVTIKQKYVATLPNALEKDSFLLNFETFSKNSSNSLGLLPLTLHWTKGQTRTGNIPFVTMCVEQVVSDCERNVIQVLVRFHVWMRGCQEPITRPNRISDNERARWATFDNEENRSPVAHKS